MEWNSTISLSPLVQGGYVFHEMDAMGLPILLYSSRSYLNGTCNVKFAIKSSFLCVAFIPLSVSGTSTL